MPCYVKVIIPPYTVVWLEYIVYFCACLYGYGFLSGGKMTAARNFARLFDYYLAWVFPILVNCWQSEFGAVWWDRLCVLVANALVYLLGTVGRKMNQRRQNEVSRFVGCDNADTHYPYVYTGRMYGPYTVCIFACTSVEKCTRAYGPCEWPVQSQNSPWFYICRNYVTTDAKSHVTQNVLDKLWWQK